jgi:hypothetical protein
MSLPGTILQLTVFLIRPEAQDPEIRLLILTTRGMLDINYDASETQANWKEVGSRALQLHHFQLATQAEGEQGIAAFLLGDTEAAKKRRLKPGVFQKLTEIPPQQYGTQAQAPFQ